MKKICLILFLMLVPTTAFPYKITNSPASTIPALVVLTKGSAISLDNLTIQSRHWINPGQSAAWHQDAIRKKKKVFKIKDFRMYIFKKNPRSWFSPAINKEKVFVVERMPINANLEILVVGQSSDQVIGGAIDYSTGKVYNQMGLDQAVQWVKRNRPDKLSSIAPLMQRANIK